MYRSNKERGLTIQYSLIFLALMTVTAHNVKILKFCQNLVKRAFVGKNFKEKIDILIKISN